MSAVVWEQEGRKELTILLEDEESASVIADILRNKELEIVWAEAWTHHKYPHAVRVQYVDSHGLS